jgi:diguanylate cyclase (GGDEF)-like protein
VPAADGDDVATIRRPEGIIEGTRWLFAVLALASLALTAPVALSSPSAPRLAGIAITSLILAGSWITGYLRRAAGLAFDVLDALAMLAFALASPVPESVLSLVFASLWFRALYGSTPRSVVRCGLYAVAVVAVLPLWHLVALDGGAQPSGGMPGAVPIMFLTVVVGRQLANGLSAREAAARCDGALAALSSKLLGLTDVPAISMAAGEAIAAMADATPGLRVLRVLRDGDGLRVSGAVGEYTAVPLRLDLHHVAAVEELGEGAVSDVTPLDEAAGAACAWTCLSLPYRRPRAWLLIGAPKRIPEDALVAIRSLANYVALALRNSDVQRTLAEQARTDSLTGLANRASFRRALDAILAHPTERPASLLYVDLDNFKTVNDVLGHAAGDDLLRVAAARLEAATRPQDVCARLGGDEFAVVLPDTSPGDAEEIARRIIAHITGPVQLGEHQARIAASVGVTTARCGSAADGLLKEADVAMYAAKAQGKGTARVFGEDLFGAARLELAVPRRAA